MPASNAANPGTRIRKSALPATSDVHSQRMTAGRDGAQNENIQPPA